MRLVSKRKIPVTVIAEERGIITVINEKGNVVNYCKRGLHNKKLSTDREIIRMQKIIASGIIDERAFSLPELPYKYTLVNEHCANEMKIVHAGLTLKDLRAIKTSSRIIQVAYFEKSIADKDTLLYSIVEHCSGKRYMLTGFMTRKMFNCILKKKVKEATDTEIISVATKLGANIHRMNIWFSNEELAALSVQQKCEFFISEDYPSSKGKAIVEKIEDLAFGIVARAAVSGVTKLS